MKSLQQAADLKWNLKSLFFANKNWDVSIEMIVENAAKIIPPVWPLHRFAACNPLLGIEFLKFEEAVKMAERLFNSGSSHQDAAKINRELIKWCQAFLDEGQATITMPGREAGFYKAWLKLSSFDKHLTRKSKAAHKFLGDLPSTSEKALLHCLDHLKVPKDQREDYLRRELVELPGWAGYIKCTNEWLDKEISIKNPITLVDFLAVRLATSCLLSDSLPQLALQKNLSEKDAASKIDFKIIEAKEENYLKSLLKNIHPFATKHDRRDAQLIFCIDVRSEPLRRHIEREGNYETFGFAGFFGVPVCLHGYVDGKMSDSCPVLLKPKHQIFEQPIGNLKLIQRHEKGSRFLELVSSFYQDLKYNFATPFALVETLGLWGGLWMAVRTLTPTLSEKMKKTFLQWVMPTVSTEPQIRMTAKEGGIPFCDQVLYAESALRMIGFTDNFSDLMVICGHGSATENNPYKASLDCGACGGNHGGPNAKILASILNDADVRRSLKDKGIDIPESTLCIAAEHNTTTDEVVIYEDQITCEKHKRRLQKLKGDLAAARGIKAKDQSFRRSKDWSEVRPEWGLSLNAAFVIGPRALTYGKDLEGRCFLHSYDWKQDESGKSLEAILTAPMIVAEWINTQYFFSTVNNVVYGSGSKVTHNVAGKIGVMQGNGSDLMHGLALQSVNSTDDEKYHDPMRLQVVVFAPLDRLKNIIKNQPVLKTLFFNEWVILVAIDPTDNKAYKLIEGKDGNQSAHFKELVN